MFKNVEWQIDSLYKNEKRIISTSSYHGIKNLSSYEEEVYNKMGDTITKTMGMYLNQKYGDELYSMAFVYREGEVGLRSNFLYPVRGRSKGTLEWKLGKEKCDYCFLDLKNPSYTEYTKPFFKMNSSFGFNCSLKAKYETVFDGIFYIDKMAPDSWFLLMDRLVEPFPEPPYKAIKSILD